MLNSPGNFCLDTNEVPLPFPCSYLTKAWENVALSVKLTIFNPPILASFPPITKCFPQVYRDNCSLCIINY